MLMECGFVELEHSAGRAGMQAGGRACRRVGGMQAGRWACRQVGGHADG